MAELSARSPLAALHGASPAATFQAGGVSMIERPELAAWLVTSRVAADIPGAIALGPCELLLVGAERPIAPSASALVQDMTGALTFIDVTGDAAFDVLGLSNVIREASGGTATRLADLRVIVSWQHAPQPWLRIAVDRFSADYLWRWLVRRIEVGVAT